MHASKAELQRVRLMLGHEVVAGAAAMAGRARKSTAEQLSDMLAAGDSGGLSLRDIDRLLQARSSHRSLRISGCLAAEPSCLLACLAEPATVCAHFATCPSQQ